MQRFKSRMTPQQFANWIERHELTRETAARTLGASPRAVYAYLAGDRDISRTVALLCQAIDDLKKLRKND